MSVPDSSDLRRPHPWVPPDGETHNDAAISEAGFRRMLDQAPVLIWIADTANRGIWYNRRWFEYTGRTMEEELGFGWSEGVHPSDRARAEALCQSAFEQRQRFDMEFRLRRANGTYGWIVDTGVPRFNDSGDFEGYIGYCWDVSEHREAEERLRETSQFLEGILENVPNMIFLKRASDLRFQYFNRAGERLLGQDRAKLVGRNDYDFFPGEQADFFTIKDREVLAQDGVVDIPEETLQTPHGTRILHTRKLALRGRNGESEYLLGISEDITERQRAERLKNALVANVSHELRTPLTCISGALALISGGAVGELSASQRGMVEIAFRNCQRLADLINDLLDMEKLGAGSLSFDFQLQQLVPLVKQALEANRVYAAQHEVSFFLTGETIDATVRVDGRRLMQVISNLLTNAVKFSPLRSTVMVSIVKNEQTVSVSVRDQGSGIPAAFRHRIFEKFAQANSADSRLKGGTGLGLAISRELIERLGGRISYDSEEGQGACFYFELPLWNNQVTVGRSSPADANKEDRA